MKKKIVFYLSEKILKKKNSNREKEKGITKTGSWKCMLFESAVISHIGCKRENNEDNYYLNGVYRQNMEKDIIQFSEPQARTGILAGVFDGAGGASCGEWASLMAVSSMTEYQERISSKCMMGEYVPNVNHKLIQEIEKYGTNMGTTMAVLLLKDDFANVYNLGDSRIYLFREQRLMQITYDHTQVQNFQRKIANSSEKINQEKYQDIKEKHILTKYLGMKNLYKCKPYFMERIPVMKHDIFILCSDGLYNMVGKHDMRYCLEKVKKETPLEIARTLAGEALLAGGKDNVTCMVIKAVCIDES